MPKQKAFCGIDVSFAKKKRLPIVICSLREGVLQPLTLKKIPDAKPPVGSGNIGALNPELISRFSQETLDYLRKVEEVNNLSIRRIAVDAPSNYKGTGQTRRNAEQAMDKRGISCIATPSQEEFSVIVEKAKRHLKNGGCESKMPHANQLWMLVGFSLFQRLKSHYEVIEVFPQAAVAMLKSSAQHKRTAAGLQKQLEAIAKRTKWPPNAQVSMLDDICYGSRHDKLDAYISAWIASLEPPQRKACGNQPDDVIWVPVIETDAQQ